MRRLTTAAAFMLAATAVLGAAGTAQARQGAETGTTASCSTAWGSGTKTGGPEYAKPLTAIKTSQDRCFDRMVFDTGGVTGKLGYHVSYVDAFHQDGSGDPIPVNGGAILQVFVSSPSYDPATMKPTYAGKPGRPLPGVNITGYKTFKDTRFGASFEGQTQIGLGVRAKLPFRVTQSGDKLIVDVAHSW
ncbi:hypothetical protein ACFPM3_06305 [Streptomyces coeruleoprunus]|uniref:AMIN-like domain-containing protein n=1 Tax=Streptomyces coeruleoprunus TaxID=285563 RepID=A0ABV9X9G6_9ACTN